ncbi:MAG: sigma-70 family RNA polymerase sigma factor [Clostridia bacterium]|nr:sigma-70 family RNA polymerase sigma factor [Clostridia bacterium]
MAEDSVIIEMFFGRNERAVEETQKKYGEYIKAIALNILNYEEDAAECENDTYLRLWNSIPPERPLNFKAYSGRIARNCALSRYRYLRAEKRDCNMSVLLSELEQCLTADNDTEKEFDGRYISSVLSDWLRSLSAENRVLFIRRYWYGDGIGELAERAGLSPQRLSSLLFSLRKQLKKELTEKGVSI